MEAKAISSVLKRDCKTEHPVMNRMVSKGSQTAAMIGHVLHLFLCKIPITSACDGLEESTSLVCCADYHLKDGACVDCPVGYFGPDCRHTCGYPWYGRRCLSKCDCPKDWCNPASGCKDPVTSGQSSSPSPASQSRVLTSNTTLPTTTTESFINSTVKMKKQQTKMYNDWNDTTTTKHLTTGTEIEAKIIRWKRKQKVTKRESVVLHARDHVDTYCEIDDIMVPSTPEDNRKSNAGKYESISQSVKERTKYTTLPTKHKHMADRNNYATPVSLAKETTESVEKVHPQCVNMEQDNLESQVLLRKASTNRNLNISVMPDAPAASKITSGYIDMNKGEKLDEYVAMEGQPQVLKNSGLQKGDNAYLMNDTYT
ncbi:uncharacterized protein LOC125678168 isoform X4 [Ostrea edulis]|uniref:uncharacterized protein LOC125678168 isoform X4 n=1 Tax=Ostrea edulis TaxID=37623 RepID=UPI0024AF27A3|nr:uncharacterized protein LOC125678168 isoform X4 [Ostrea edulis]